MKIIKKLKFLFAFNMFFLIGFSIILLYVFLKPILLNGKFCYLEPTIEILLLEIIMLIISVIIGIIQSFYYLYESFKKY